MSIYSDDFQSYPVGAAASFGSFNSTGFFQSSIITSPAGILGKSKCVQVPGVSGLELQTISYYPSVSVFSGFYVITWDQTLFQFNSDNINLCSIITESDGTIAIISGTSRIAIGLNDPQNLFKWLWAQFNISISDVGGFIQIDAEIAINEKSIASGSLLTSIATSSLAFLGMNKFTYGARQNVAEFTLDFLQAIGTDPNPGLPAAHVTQGLNEVGIVPDSALVRVTQGVSEVDILPDTALIRITQGIIELYLLDISSQGWQIYEA